MEKSSLLKIKVSYIMQKPANLIISHWQNKQLDFFYYCYGMFQTEKECQEELKIKLMRQDYLLDSCMNGEFISIIRKALDSLEPKMRQIIYEKFFLNHTFKQLAKDHKMSIQGIQYWEQKALKKLKDFKYKNKTLEDFTDYDYVL